MYKKLVYLIMTLLVLLSLTFCPPIMKTIRAAPTEKIVPDNYPTIQEAIDNASAGDTIRVETGTYHEHIFVNKSVKLIGENQLNTIIDGDGIGTVVHIDSPNVSIIGFTIQNGGEGLTDFGVYLSESAVNVTIRNNIIRNNLYGGLRLLRSANNNILDNKIVENFYCDIGIFDNSSNNNIIGNTISNSFFGVWFDNSSNNTLYHNSFINNTKQVELYGVSINIWDNGAEGNYWSDYIGVDADGDGIGDTGYPDPYFLWDNYPLIEPWSLIRVVDVYQNEEHHYVTIYCNSTVGWRRDNVPFFFNQPKKRISFNVTGPSNTMGYCNVTIPKQLLNATPTSKWKVFLDDDNITGTVNISENATYTSLYFTYTHSTHKVQVIGTEAISNLPPTADFTYSPLNHNSINFTHASTDPDGTIIRWYWDFEDGANSTEQNPIHQFAENHTYTVTLTVTDNVQASSTISKTVIVGKIKLILNVPSTTTVGETIITTAALKDEGDNPIPNENIDFYARTYGEWKKFGSASTNASGVASVIYTPAIWGEHQIMACYNGSAAHIKNNITATIMVNPLVITLTIDTPDPLTLTLGKTITITATIKDENGVPIPNATIEFYLFEDETWETIGSKETDSNGIAVLEYTPPAAGKFYIKAEFSGTQIYGKTSDVITLIVNFDYTPYILVGVAAIAAIALIAFAIWRKRKKHIKSEHSQE